MLDLIAQGPRPELRWRRPLAEGETLEIGRQTGACSVAWDELVSRRHVQVRREGERLHVRRLSESRNPVFFRGQQLDEFWLADREHFVIGQTTFTLSGERPRATGDVPLPNHEQRFSHEMLEQIRYRDAEKRIAVLGQLPEMISSARNELDLLARLTNVLLAGIEAATSVAIVQQSPGADPPEIDILHWDRRGLSPQPFEPSARLIRSALEQQQSVLHLWQQPEAADAAFTLDAQHRWAFATPVVGGATAGWALYVAGASLPTSLSLSDRATPQVDLRGDVKFAELVGAMLANLRNIQRLERAQAGLRPFFSPVVLEAIADRDPDEVLAPRECDAVVLFCDLRGFSRTSERLADNLFELLRRVSRALGTTTRQILANGGVVGDFHGDATMGFWGWPLAQPRAASAACRTALTIKQELRQLADSEPTLRDFRIGIGLASGRAVAGQIGTVDQVKVTAFGPVVNLAARLEALTALVGAPILIDERIARQLKADDPGAFHVRPLAPLRPYGLTQPVAVHQLLSPDQRPDDSAAAAFATALQQWQSGAWRDAAAALRTLSSTDPVAGFFLKSIEEGGGLPPENWDGVLSLDRKR